MRKLGIGVLDLVSRGPTRAWFGRVMNANLASIMPQVVGIWCRQEGHDVTFVCNTGFEDLLKELPDNVDLVFISAYTAPDARSPPSISSKRSSDLIHL